MVYYYNQGNTTVTISSFALGGTNPGDFSTSGSGCSAGGQVSALSYCTFRITIHAGCRGSAQRNPDDYRLRPWQSARRRHLRDGHQQ